jgi:hypothetical protein
MDPNPAFSLLPTVCWNTQGFTFCKLCAGGIVGYIWCLYRGNVLEEVIRLPQSSPPPPRLAVHFLHLFLGLSSPCVAARANIGKLMGGMGPVCAERAASGRSLPNPIAAMLLPQLLYRFRITRLDLMRGRFVMAGWLVLGSFRVQLSLASTLLKR